MEAQLASIRASLESLHTQNIATIAHASRPAYFTNAVLNPQRLDILELLRDADALESSLFVTNRQPNSENAPGPSTTPAEPKPFLRPVPVPTPLKQAPTSDTDARTYLLAAEKLLQNYHNAPRARKHIRMLLKREAELQRHMARYKATIDQAGKTPAQHHARPSGTTATPGSQSRPSSQSLRQLKDDIQREKMEILALESMLSESESSAQHRTSAANAGRSATSSPTRFPVQAKAPHTPVTRSSAARSTVARSPTAGRTPLGRSIAGDSPIRPTPSSLTLNRLSQSVSGSPTRAATPRSVARTSPRKAALSQSVAASPTQPTTPLVQRDKRPLAQSVSTPRSPHSPVRSLRTPHTPRTPQTPRSTRAPGVPSTPRASPPKSSASPSLVPHGVMPTPTEELERMSAKIWELFGENVRYAAPGCRSASFPDTFKVLRALEQGAPNDADTAGITGDASNPTVPPSIGTIMMAHVLLLLMRSQAPHTLPLPMIKSYSDNWWKQEGQDQVRAGVKEPATRNPLVQQLGIDASDLEQTGDALATRAVYGLVAKKILRIQRAGGAANVRFA